MNDNLVLAPGYILITPEEEQSTSSVKTYTDSKEDYERGIAVLVGPTFVQEGLEITPPCKAGDSVLYSFGGYGQLDYQGKKVRIVRFSSIVGVFEKGKNATRNAN